jgi:hypothetical protein
LAEAHDEIRARMDAWLEAAVAAAPGPLRDAFARFESLLLAHAAMEDAHLIPSFVAHGLESAGCTAAILRTEHDKLRRHLASARAALPPDGSQLTPRARVAMVLGSHALRELLEHHDQRERAGFFPALDAAFAPAERARLYAICARSQSSAAAREDSAPSSCNS